MKNGLNVCCLQERDLTPDAWARFKAHEADFVNRNEPELRELLKQIGSDSIMDPNDINI